MNKRGSGILMHVSSLASPYGIGDLGKSAYDFIDFLKKATQSWWQLLPLNPTSEDQHNSPYRSNSAFAGNAVFIAPDKLFENGLLSKAECDYLQKENSGKVDFKYIYKSKLTMLDSAFNRAKSQDSSARFDLFCEEHHDWLDDHALHTVLRNELGVPWVKWPTDLKNHSKRSLDNVKNDFVEAIKKEKFIQYLFHSQWQELHRYSQANGIQIIGDMPYYVSLDSVDVWVNQDLFKLDNNGNYVCTGGVPPDSFSASGQNWHVPVYNWNNHKTSNFSWWVRRFKRMIELVDVVRVDHFRGFAKYWEIPVLGTDATKGSWQPVPTDELFNTLFKHFYSLPIIAEDLGSITTDVREMINKFSFPGMRVLLFAFDNDNPLNPYLPHSFVKNCLACTGNHDTPTIKGWLEEQSNEEQRRRLYRYTDTQTDESVIPQTLIRLTMQSTADMVIFPMQDILNLGNESRMNNPSRDTDNWSWRIEDNQLTNLLVGRMSEMTRTYGRI